MEARRFKPGLGLIPRNDGLQVALPQSGCLPQRQLTLHHQQLDQRAPKFDGLSFFLFLYFCTLTF